MSDKNDTRAMLLTAGLWKLVLSLSVPAIIGMVVVGLYNLMDAVFVGQMVGSNAMTAVSVAYPFTLVNTGVATLIGAGSASILSRAIGKKDQSTVDRIMGNLIAWNLIFSIAITVIGMIFTGQILRLSGAEGEILDIATRYLRIIFAGSTFVNFAQSANMIMRGEGRLKRAMLISGGTEYCFRPDFDYNYEPCRERCRGSRLCNHSFPVCPGGSDALVFPEEEPECKNSCHTAGEGVVFRNFRRGLFRHADAGHAFGTADRPLQRGGAVWRRGVADDSWRDTPGTVIRIYPSLGIESGLSASGGDKFRREAV